MNRHWALKLGDVCEIVSGATPKTGVKEYWSGDIPWATPADLSDLDGHYIEDTPRKITAAGLASCAARVLPANSVLLSSRAPIGHVAINAVPMATNQGFKSLIPKEGLTDAKYLFHWLLFNKGKIQALGNGATFKEVSKAIVSEIGIDLPPLDEQRRIAAILDKADALRQKRERAIALLDSLTQSIFLEMFGSLSNSYSIADLINDGSLLVHKDGNHGSSYPRAEEFSESGVPFLSAKCVGDDGAFIDAEVQFLSEKKAMTLKHGWIQKGDVVLAHNASVGKVALYQGQYGRALIGTSLTCFRPDQARMTSDFLFAALRSDRFQVQLASNMGQTTRNQVPITAQRNLLLPRPSIDLQIDYAHKLQRGRKTASDLLLAHQASEAMFASLQHRAFSGQL